MQGCRGQRWPVTFPIKNMVFLEQFADRVIDFTSKYNNVNSLSYSPENLPGKPAMYPQYGDFPATYMLRSYGKWASESEGAQPEYMPQDVDHIVSEDYVTVRFEVAVVPKEIIIYETYHPGAVVRLYGRHSKEYKWHLLYEEAPHRRAITTCRMFRPYIPPINDVVDTIKIVFNQSLLGYHTSLDAVLLAGFKPDSDLQLNLLKAGFLSFKAREVKVEVKKFVPEEDAKDYFTTLPYEVIVHIFKNLDLKSLSRCAQVNRRWREATLDSTIYQALSFKKYWMKADDSMIKHFKHRCKRMRKLDMSWCGNGQIDENLFREFLRTCGAQLTHLAVNNCDFIRNVAMGQIAKCTDLVDLRLRNIFPSVWTFSLLGNLSKLVAIDLFASSIKDDSLIKLLTANVHLKHLNIDFCENLSCLDQVARTLGTYNKNLITLSCWKTHTLTADGVRHLGECHRLRELDLGWCLILSDPLDCLDSIAQGCPDLRRLIISNWRGLGEHSLVGILNSCKELTHLDLMSIKSITGNFIALLMFSLPKLTLLDISFCDLIEEDKVDSLRHIYPKVQIKRSCQNTVAYSNYELTN